VPEPGAVVIAETMNQARDAAELDHVRNRGDDLAHPIWTAGSWRASRMHAESVRTIMAFDWGIGG